MPLKSYSELRKVDVKPFCKFRKAKDENKKEISVPYLNWAKCKDLLHENGASKVYFEPCVNENGSSLFKSDCVFTDSNGGTNRCYEVRVHIVIDDLDFEAQFPLMNGSNPVKDNSLTQQRLWNAQTRAFVKGVAMHTGLGFDLWLNDDTDIIDSEDLSGQNALLLKKRIEQLITYKLSKGKNISEIAKAAGLTEKQINQYLNALVLISNMEKKIEIL